MKCPMCGYMMDAFDKECPRCHGKGVPQSVAQPQDEPAPQPPAQPPTPQAAPSHYSRFCPHCSAAMSISMQYCPVCRKKNTAPAAPPPASINIKLSPILGIIAVLFIVAFAGYRHWTQTPQYSLWQAQKAADAHDLGTFEKYVDIDNCVESYIDDMMAGLAAQQPKATQNGFEQMGQQFAQDLIAMMKPTLVSAIKKQIRDYVEKGEVEKERDAKRLGLSVEELKNKAKEQEVEYDGVEYVKQEGSIALVGLKFVNRKDDSKSFTVELKMRWLDGYWQLSKWSNAFDVLKKFGLGEQSNANQTITQPAPDSKLPTPQIEAPEQPQVQSQVASPTEEEKRYFALAEEISEDVRNETRNVATASEAYRAGDASAFRNAASEAQSKMDSALSELNAITVPPRFSVADSYLRRGVSSASEGFGHWVRFAESEDRNERQAAISKLEAAVPLLGQSMKERDKIKDSFR